MKITVTTTPHTLLIFSVLLMTGTMINTAAAADYPAPGNFSNGSKVWAENCTRCHNMRGPRELRDDQWITTAYHMRLRAGLTGEETRDVITFLQASNAKVSASAAPASKLAINHGSGKTIYNQTCISCHGADGTGAFPGVPDFTNGNEPLSKPDDVLIDHITHGFKSIGSPMAMPAKGGNKDLNGADVKAVLKYIRNTFWNTD